MLLYKSTSQRQIHEMTKYGSNGLLLSLHSPVDFKGRIQEFSKGAESGCLRDRSPQWGPWTKLW